MNFIKYLINKIRKYFIHEPIPIIDVSKVFDYGDMESDEIPEMPAELVSEPFYKTLLSDELVETPLDHLAQLPKVEEHPEPPQLDDTAMDTSIQR